MDDAKRWPCDCNYLKLSFIRALKLAPDYNVIILKLNLSTKIDPFLQFQDFKYH